MLIKYALGIDVSAKTLQCCICTIDVEQDVKIKATSSFANSPSGFKQLHSWIIKHHKCREIPLLISMEATGVYYEACALYLFMAGLKLSVLLPNKAKKYMQAMGLKSKNDSIDAKGLARMAAEQALESWQPMSEFYFSLRALTRQLQAMQEMRTSLLNQLHAAQLSMYPQKLVISQLKKLVLSMKKEIVKLEEAIEAHLRSEPEVLDKVKKMASIKGVGILTVAVVLAETNGFALFENQSQLVSYAGYDVVENQSGKRSGKTRISKKGNSRIRRSMHMPALIVVRYKVPPFINLFERTYKKHNIKMKSYVAVQKKLLVILFSLWKKDTVFSPELEINTTNTEEHPMLSSRLGLEQAINKNSPTLSRATQGKLTREVTPSASSRLLQS